LLGDWEIYEKNANVIIFFVIVMQQSIVGMQSREYQGERASLFPMTGYESTIAQGIQRHNNILRMQKKVKWCQNLYIGISAVFFTGTSIMWMLFATDNLRL
jgi:hypothetical protein